MLEFMKMDLYQRPWSLAPSGRCYKSRPFIFYKVQVQGLNVNVWEPSKLELCPREKIYDTRIFGTGMAVNA